MHDARIYNVTYTLVLFRGCSMDPTRHRIGEQWRAKANTFFEARDGLSVLRCRRRMKTLDVVHGTSDGMGDLYKRSPDTGHVMPYAPAHASQGAMIVTLRRDLPLRHLTLGQTVSISCAIHPTLIIRADTSWR